MNGKLIVISGPSGVGKSTVVKQVMERLHNLHFSVSATTRPIRPGEIDGKNYYFVDRDQFQTMIDRHELLEYAEYVGNYYGTPEAPIDDALAKGQDILLDIEVQGALNVKRRRPDAVLIFMMAPSFTELERRLSGRGDTAPEIVADRLKHARWEFSHAHEYDYLVVNDQVEHAVDEIISIVTAEKCRMETRIHVLKEEL